MIRRLAFRRSVPVRKRLRLRCRCHGDIMINMGGKFNEPRLALNRIYTKRGDTGQTSLVGGQRLPKDARRRSLKAYTA